MRLFLKKIVGFKNRLTKLNDDEPITKLALCIIILLDIFILSIIFGGLSDHTAQLTSAGEYFPSECRRVFIEKDWTQANKTAKLQNLVLSEYNNYSYRYESPLDKTKIEKMHPLCRRFYKNIKSIADNGELKELFIKRQETARKKGQLVKQYDKENEVYNTTLLENIAGKDSAKLESISLAMKKRAGEIERLSAQISGINGKLNNSPLIKELWSLIRPGDRTLRNKLINDLNRYERMYLFKELVWQLLFLLPLFAIFYIWHAKSTQKTGRIQTLISAHLLVVVVIPIVFKVINVVLELIPRHFFKELFELLERLHIIALWHYVAILISIGITVFCVYIIQKKVFNRSRLYEKRLMKGGCYSCGKILPGKIGVCPFCGTKQLRKCSGCNADTYISGKFCTSCGQEQN